MAPKRKLTNNASSKAPSKKVQTTLTSAITSTVAATNAAKDTLGSVVPQAITTAAAEISPTNNHIAPTQGHDYDALIVNRTYYPPVLSNERCQAYLDGNIPTPHASLNRTLADAAGFREQVARDRAVVCWFRTDLRWDDNTALAMASTLTAGEVPVIGLFILSPQDLDAHLMSPARTDFMLRSLQVLKDDLEKRGIPLYCETVEKRKRIPGRVLELAEEWRAKHVFANMEYEVDELRRDENCVSLGVEKGIAVHVVHDTCVVPPDVLLTKSTNKPFAVYSPWFKAWKKYVLDRPDHCTTLRPSPVNNPASARTDFADLFTNPLPTLPTSHTPTPALSKTLRALFPAGQHSAHARLTTFISKRIHAYSDDRNTPSTPGTSVLSPHLTTGTLSARTCLHAALAANNNTLSGASPGITTWISELAWRDFYRHVLTAWPYICMNKPFKPTYSSIIWCTPSLTTSRLELWKAGKTGYPLIDAAMRQLRAHCWLPNRVRMVVASFLAKDLHVDWRLGEQYFMQTLVDADFASNSGGWGFASSTGVDPQPYFRVFNPTTQSETWDAEGEYIRTWVEELRGVGGKEVHNPSAAVRRETGYPGRCVEHDVMRKEAVEMYKRAVERGKVVG